MTRMLLDGVAWQVDVSGEGSPLLLLHGFTGSAATWSDASVTWRSGHRLIAPDLLGHGRSGAPADPARYALERQAADLATMLHELDAVPADVVGYSMGARLALVLGLEHTGDIRRLVLESPSAGFADATERAARRAADEALADAIEDDGLEAFVDRWEVQPLFASHARLPPLARQRIRRERLGHDPAGLAGSLRGAGQGAMAPLQERLATLGAPTLVVAGDRDPLGVGRAREVATAVPGARLEVIAGAGHSPHLERPPDFIRISTEFLEAQAR